MIKIDGGDKALTGNHPPKKLMLSLNYSQLANEWAAQNKGKRPLSEIEGNDNKPQMGNRQKLMQSAMNAGLPPRPPPTKGSQQQHLNRNIPKHGKGIEIGHHPQKQKELARFPFSLQEYPVEYGNLPTIVSGQISNERIGHSADGYGEFGQFIKSGFNRSQGNIPPMDTREDPMMEEWQQNSKECPGEG